MVASGWVRACNMCGRGRKSAVWAKWSLGVAAVFLGTGAIGVTGNNYAPKDWTGVRALGALIVSPAYAGRRGDGGSDARRQAEAAQRRARDEAQAAQKRAHAEAEIAQKRAREQAEAAQKNAHAINDRRQAETAQKLAQDQRQKNDGAQKGGSDRRKQSGSDPKGPLQQVKQAADGIQIGAQGTEAAQRRIQQLQQAAAAQQKRVQDIQQAEESRKRVETSPRVHPGQNQLFEALRKRHNANRLEAGKRITPTQPNINAHNLGNNPNNSVRREQVISRFSNSVAERIRERSHGHRQNDGGAHEPRHKVVFDSILKKLSRYSRNVKDAPKEPAKTTTQVVVAVASPPAAVAPIIAKTVPKVATKSNTSLLDSAPDVRAVANTTVSRLPEVASNITRSESTRSESTPDNGMSRLGGPRQSSSDDKGDERNAADDRASARLKAQKRDDGSDKDAGPSGKPQVRNLGRRGVANLLPPVGTFKSNEILAINPKPEDLATVLANNFKVLDRTKLPELDIDLVRLSTPSSQNALIGRTTLHEAVPTGGFGLNHIYVAGRASTTEGTKSSSNRGKPQERDAGPCVDERCFGVSVINWQPQLATCARDVRIGVIDTGVDKTHPAFAGLSFEHENFVPPDRRKPPSQHGTGIFSLLAGNARSSTPGLVPNATFLVGDAFYMDGNGNATSDTYTMLKALNWLKKEGVDIANLSFAGPRDELVEHAMTELARAGTLVLAAVGNEALRNIPSYPAAYKEVIAVTAVDRNLAPYVYANQGSYVDVAAPGVDVWTALPNGREGRQTGTSFAVPFVTSVVALNHRSALSDGNPLGPKQRALALLQQNIKSLGNRNSPVHGAGLVQAPRNCEPRGPAIAATTKAAPPAQASPPQADLTSPPVVSVVNRK